MSNRISGEKPTCVLIADSDVNSIAYLSRELFKSGYDPVSGGIGGATAIEAARMLRPDVVILDASLPDMDGVELAEILHAEAIAPAVLIAEEVTPEIVRRAARAMVYSIMVKPIQIARLVPAIEIAMGQWGELRRQVSRISDMQAKEEARDIVMMAKRVLIETQGMSEPTAYRMMRDLSMNTRRTMKAVAEEVLQTAEATRRQEFSWRSVEFSRERQEVA